MRMDNSLSEAKHIVIAGAGFGGLHAALILARHRALQNRGYDIVLIDRHHHHLYTPALYEIAAIPSEYANDASLTASVLIPIADVIRTKPIRFISDEIIGRDGAMRRIMLRNGGALSYDYLVLALGSQTNYFDIPGLAAYATPLKTCDDATLLRNRIERALKQKPSLTIIVGGAGASGVEVVAELVNFVCMMKAKIAPESTRCDVAYFLAEASGDILPGFSAWIVARAQRRLERIGVTIKTGAAISSADQDAVTFADGQRQHYDVLIWTGGVKGPAVLGNLHLPLSPKGTLVVGPDLRVQDGGGRILAVGDNAWFMDSETQKPLPWSVPVAESQGRHAAREIIRAIRGEKPRPFMPRRRYPFILAVGKKYALADLVCVRLGGFAGWCAKQLVELRYLFFLLPWPRAVALWWRDITMYRSND